MKNLLALTLSLISTLAVAHPGHLPNEVVHGFLHVEHIIAFVILGIVAYAVLRRNR